MILEMFFWTRPLGRRIFAMDAGYARSTRVLAANQGLYNGFLSVGLVWALIQGPAGFDTAVFFLACVIAAGVFGALTASRRILWIQALPAVAALALLLSARAT